MAKEAKKTVLKNGHVIDPAKGIDRVADVLIADGKIAAVYVGNPHATLDVDVEGEIWRVELAPPSRTIAAGFTEKTAKIGDEVTAIGNRSRDETEKRMKATRLIVNGNTYEVYPGRTPS